MKNLETNRLNLRKFRKEDAPLMYKNWASDENCTVFLSWDVHNDVSETQTIIDFWVNKYSANNYFNWAIEEKSTNEIIGNVETVRFVPQKNSLELAYCLGSKYWGCGYMTEAIKAIIEYLFEKYDLIVIRCDVENTKSENVAKRLGMEFVCVDGTLNVYHLKKSNFI